jgi:hypothetical protein
MQASPHHPVTGGWPLGQMTDTELVHRLDELKQALKKAAEVPGGSTEWREIELQIAEVMTEVAERSRIRKMPLNSELAASELYAYNDHTPSALPRSPRHARAMRHAAPSTSVALVSMTRSAPVNGGVSS